MNSVAVGRAAVPVIPMSATTTQQLPRYVEPEGDELRPGDAAKIYDLGYRAGERSGHHDGYWHGYADAVEDRTVVERETSGRRVCQFPRRRRRSGARGRVRHHVR